MYFFLINKTNQIEFEIFLKYSLKKLLKEEDRIGAVINKIENEAYIVPRGSFVQQPTGEIVKNRLFEGLAPSEAAKLGNYFHFREAKLLEEKSLLFRANLDKAVDFLDPVDEDQPSGNFYNKIKIILNLLIFFWLKAHGVCNSNVDLGWFYCAV